MEEVLSGLCFDFGASGVAEELEFRQTSLRYQPEIVENSTVDLNAYFDRCPEENFFLRLQSLVPSATVNRLEEENRDWLEEWKKGFEPFCLVESVWVVPSWREVPNEAQQAIFIDPGMAFGTGTHATTQLAAGLIVHAREKWPQGFSALDVGTGTGILAMLLALMGAGEVQATEIDVEAREVGRQNLVKNNLEFIRVLDEQVEQLITEFDLVVANIIDGILLDLREALMARTKPDGWLLLTGILLERKEDFLKDFLRDSSWQVKEEVVLDEWCGLLLKRAERSDS